MTGINLSSKKKAESIKLQSYFFKVNNLISRKHKKEQGSSNQSLSRKSKKHGDLKPI